MTEKFLKAVAVALIAGAAGIATAGAQNAAQPTAPDQGGCTNCPQGAGDHHEGKGKGKDGHGHGHHNGQEGSEGGKHAPTGN